MTVGMYATCHPTFAANQTSSSQKTRESFINFFKCHDYLFVPSSSVIPKRMRGLTSISYFINAGMSQVEKQLCLTRYKIFTFLELHFKTILL